MYARHRSVSPYFGGVIYTDCRLEPVMCVCPSGASRGLRPLTMQPYSSDTSSDVPPLTPHTVIVNLDYLHVRTAHEGSLGFRLQVLGSTHSLTASVIRSRNSLWPSALWKLSPEANSSIRLWNSGSASWSRAPDASGPVPILMETFGGNAGGL